jgi:hypothetical protein
MVLAASPDLDIIYGWSETGWYDTELEIECFFLPDESGVERCFPGVHLGGSLRYADADCTQPVMTSGSGPCWEPRFQYVVEDRFGADGCGHRGFHIGSELPATTPLFTSGGGTCAPYPYPISSDSRLLALEAVPASTFVGMQRVPRPRIPGMDAMVREGEDGSWQVVDFFDTRRGAVCRDLSPLVTPYAICAPVFATLTSDFADASCEARVARTSCEREEPTAVLDPEYDSAACPTAQSLDLFEVSESARDTELFESDDSGACVETGKRSNIYLPGAPIDLATLPNTEIIEVGDGPVRGRFLGVEGVPFFPAFRTGPLVEAASGEGCSPYDFADGITRCVPSSFPIQVGRDTFYEGSSCDGAPLHPWNEAACPRTPEPRGVVVIEVQTCGNGVATETFAVSGKSDARVVSRVNGTTGACEAFDLAMDTSTFFVIGESLDPADVFSSLERVTRD